MAYYNRKKILAVNNVIEAQSEHVEVVKSPTDSTFAWKDELKAFCENLNNSNRTSNYLLLTIVSSNDEDFNGATSIVCQKNQVIAGDVNKYRFQGSFVDKDGVTKIVNVVVDTNAKTISYLIEEVKKLYLHTTQLDLTHVSDSSNTAQIYASIYCHVAEEFTQDSLEYYMKTHGFMGVQHLLRTISAKANNTIVNGGIYFNESANRLRGTFTIIHSDMSMSSSAIANATLVNDMVFEV